MQVLPSAKELHEFSDSIITLQRQQADEIETYADSLRIRNLTLNAQLNHFVSNLDRQIYLSFCKREHKIENIRNESFRLLAITLSVAIILLLLSYFTIHREIKRNIRAKTKKRN